jgi:hydrogenase maturation protease
MRLVLAYGNPLRNDDGVGWRVASALRAPDVEVLCLHQLVPELAFRLVDADGVLFVDAEAGPQPGRIVTRELAPHDDERGLWHALSPQGLLALACHLNGQAPPAVIVTVTAADLGFGSALSAPVEAALVPAVEMARRALADLGRRNTCGPSAAER